MRLRMCDEVVESLWIAIYEICYRCKEEVSGKYWPFTLPPKIIIVCDECKQTSSYEVIPEHIIVSVTGDDE